MLTRKGSECVNQAREARCDMAKRILSIIMSLVLCVGLMPLIAFASEGEVGILAAGGLSVQAGELQKPQNTKVTVTDVQKGTMQADGYGQLTGNIATLAVTIEKVPGANQFFVCPLKRTAPGSSYSSFEKVGEGTMPTVNTPPSGKPTFESFDGDVEVGPNGEKITETDKAITVEKKVCILDGEPASNLEGAACYKKDDSAVMEVQALYTDKDNYGNNKSSEAVRIEFPVSSISKGKTFTEGGEEPSNDAAKVPIAGIELKAASATYNGKAKKPVIKSVKAGDRTLTQSDYTVTYKNAKGKIIKVSQIKAAGTYWVIVTGKGDYTGSKAAKFTIKKAQNKLTVKAKTTKEKPLTAKQGETTKFALSKYAKVKNPTKGKLAYKKVSGNKMITVNKKTGKITVKKGLPGATYLVKVKVTSASTTNYKTVSKTVKVYVVVK